MHLPNLGISLSYIRASVTCFDMKSLNPLQKTKLQVFKWVKYFNFVEKKRRHGNFKGEYHFSHIFTFKRLKRMKRSKQIIFDSFSSDSQNLKFTCYKLLIQSLTLITTATLVTEYCTFFPNCLFTV